MAEMQTKKQNKGRIFKALIYLMIALLLVLVYLCNREIVFMQDDLWYWTNLKTGTAINGVKDIVQSQIWHYFNWGGRTVAHTLLQFLLWGGGTFCNIVNTIAFAALSVFLGKQGKKWNASMLLLAGSMLVAFNPNIIETLFWQSGCANYLYMTLLSFPLAGIYLSQLSKEEEKVIGNPAVEILKACGVFIWGILAGWTNENLGPCIFLITIAVEIILMRRKKKIAPWMIAGSVSTAIGSACMILAPGNYVREDTITSLGSRKLDLFKRVVDYFRGAFEYLLLAILVTILVYVMYRMVLKKLPDPVTYILIGAGVVSYLALVISPHLPDRATFGIMCFFIWATLRMFSEICEEIKKERFRFLITFFIAAVALHKLFFLWAGGVGWYRYV